ncbi:uncharacterized protein PGTG_19560 [Puccinia graminis f. sp. tritici CRL 75-36-700-3]|uniref:Uncharacterized protein n=1 Tax=Puccinia graminis f. sp. tritici (strain CRL 75-36-700-3 / race SCCL) TaxID=418459 RepID=E3LAU0_PUCGT|nr:uncharacterized protein PGTG_19560 [Puccinia graminis f. sp. tritici CRL 75-36-700-3]EFP93665.1 hypothetical protein PGTG_19560 [Puccinia graminis f. sp. tritici CRL 75-36-700-3]
MYSGATAGIFYNFVFFPADSIKSTMQTASELTQTSHLPQSLPAHEAPKNGFLDVGLRIVKTRGWKGLYAGLLATKTRVAADQLWGQWEPALRSFEETGVQGANQP